MKTFYRKIENFICENCGNKIIGNGYTNHCSHCFYSKHVDVNPGDRSSDCLGLMLPINYETNNKKGISIVHKCEKCKMIKRNKMQEGEEISALLSAIRSNI